MIIGYTEFIRSAKKVIQDLNLPLWIECQVMELPDPFFISKESVQQLSTFLEPGTIVVVGDRTAIHLKKYINNLIIPVQVTVFDLLEQIKQINLREVNIMNYYTNLEEISSIENLLTVKINQIEFHSKQETYEIFKQLKENGVTHVIGGSWVCKTAPQFDLEGVFYYSYQSMKKAFTQIVSILKSNKSELENHTLFKTIVDINRSGVLYTDSSSTLTVINQTAQRLLGIKSNQVIDKPLNTVYPFIKMDQSLLDNDSHNNIIIEHNQKKLTVDVVPVTLYGENMGHILAIDDINELLETERTIRKKIAQKPMIANYHFDHLIGTSQTMKEVTHQAKKFSQTNSSILIQGETGTGKELFAQSIHNASNRSRYPFVAVNCAALPESLLDSELFGYEEGAFTGARKGGKIGLFELAHQGTIFLDEISELPLHLQSRLLRVLQEREIVRIGGNQVIPVDIRVIVASNKDLLECIRNSEFREDLYYRVSILQLKIPPLRHRKSDIHEIFKYFLKDEPQLLSWINSGDSSLLSYNWPGNVRELQNVAERFLVLSKGEKLNSQVVKSRLQQAIYPNLPSYVESKFQNRLKSTEHDQIQDALNQTKGNKDEAARLLGISRTTLWRKLKQM